MPSPDYNFLIIGQGLAGSILAHTLITQGQRVMVIDNDHQGSASHVAAGIINPITGHRLNLTQNFENLHKTAKSYYSKLEYHIKHKLIRDIEQQRLIKNPSQHSYFEKRLAEPNYQAYITETDSQNDYFKQTDYGSASIFNTQIVDTKNLLNATQQWLKSLHSYRTDHIDYAKLICHKEHIVYDDISAQTLIFCEGYQAIHNPWLKNLPFKLAKGEILSIETSKKSDSDPMLSWGNWFIPNKITSTAKLGSNYAWNNHTLDADDGVKEKLLNSFIENTHHDAKVIKHEVGVRPCTTQRLPFIGPISTLKNAYCFNGFGSKGCLIIPHYAQLLSDHLLKQTELANEITQWL